MTHRRSGNGRMAAAFPWTARCASRPTTAPGASVCCATAPARRSPCNGYASSMPSTSSTTTQSGPRRQRPLILTPLELLDRIAALMPPPRIHRRRYFDLLARTAAHRKFPLQPPPAGGGRRLTGVGRTAANAALLPLVASTRTSTQVDLGGSETATRHRPLSLSARITGTPRMSRPQTSAYSKHTDACDSCVAGSVILRSRINPPEGKTPQIG